MADIDEKLGKLEDKIDSLEEALLAHMQKEEQERRVMEQRLQSIQDTIIKYKGFVGGVIFVITALWAVLQMAGKFFGKG